MSPQPSTPPWHLWDKCLHVHILCSPAQLVMLITRHTSQSGLVDFSHALSSLSSGLCQLVDRMNTDSCVHGVDVDVVDGLDLGSSGDNQPC